MVWSSSRSSHHGSWHGTTHFLARFLLETKASTVTCYICAIITSSFPISRGRKGGASKGRKPLYTYVWNVKGTDLPRKGNRYAYFQTLLSEIPRNSPHWTLSLNRSAYYCDTGDRAIGIASLRGKRSNSTAHCNSVLWVHFAQ